MNKKIKIAIIVTLIFIILIFFLNFTYKKIRNGNNIYKSKEDFIEYIFSINSYSALLEITVNSNKTSNKYVVEQFYSNPNFFKQIVKYPENIKNLETIYNGKELIIKNRNINASKIYQDINNIDCNKLWLSSFIINSKEHGYNVMEEKEEILISSNNEILYINKNTKLPKKLEIYDNNKNLQIYIEYKEISINNIKDNSIFAFLTQNIKEEV